MDDVHCHGVRNNYGICFTIRVGVCPITQTQTYYVLHVHDSTAREIRGESKYMSGRDNYYNI